LNVNYQDSLFEIGEFTVSANQRLSPLSIEWLINRVKPPFSYYRLLVATKRLN